MNGSYDPARIEPKWQREWAETGLFRAPDRSDSPKFYCLMMFPYPSAALHVGHGRNYIIGDVLARYKMMRGCNVLAPMGWDAFGLPAENAAIQGGVHPRTGTLANIATMKRQLHDWGVCYDWDREIASCDPSYYRWTQWLFLRLHERGLACRKTAAVNWCPSCSTVLANEQVVGGGCERCETPVRQKELEQWFFRITAYAQRLLDDLDLLGNWPERVKTMQRNWIGRSEGCEVVFRLASTGEPVPCFTTRLDTIHGATYMVLAAEHPLARRIAAARGGAVADFIERTVRQDRLARAGEGAEKEGIRTGEEVINPFNGERIPLWIANYVLMEYGTGAVMAVPAHDDRDFAFARKYGLPVRVVIRDPAAALPPAEPAAAYVDDGIQVNSARFDGLPNREALERMADLMEEAGFGGRTVCYRLRDWLISRQRYWGAPIPIIHCESCGAVPVPDQDLPVLLPEEVEFRPGGESPLARCPAFVRCACPSCGRPARRETDTMDTFVDSSWYFLRFVSPRDDGRPFDPDLANRWLPVDQYIGGIEHAILHLLYARFVTKALMDMGWVGFPEPFRNLFTQGMIIKDGAKMSKSRGNTVSPDGLIEAYGADTVRLYTLFIGPPEKDAEWRDESIVGAHRFLRGLWDLVREAAGRVARAAPGGGAGEGTPLRRAVHRTIRKVTADIEERFHFNTALAALMELENGIRAFMRDVPRPAGEAAAALDEAVRTIVLLLGPFAPHIAEELWRAVGGTESVFRQPWPAHDPALVREEEATVVVQVNGRVRGRITVPADAPEEALAAAALAERNVAAHVGGRRVVRTVVVPGRLVNIVVG
ncbi:MAG: leucine--tRNA ligase [bacterium]|nr:leucine--tRNA ligase [bacterium]